VLYVVGLGFLGVVFLASGIEGYLVLVGRLGVLNRILSIAGGFLLFMPDMLTNLAGAAILAFMFLKRYLM
jgi:TRAP-type uncharacterized transport system fused permease subunit